MFKTVLYLIDLARCFVHIPFGSVVNLVWSFYLFKMSFF